MDTNLPINSSTRKLPFNAIVLISQYLSRPYSFGEVQISTNPTLTIKTDIARDLHNPKKKKIKRTTTFKSRKPIESSCSLIDASYLLEDNRSSMNISRISETHLNTKNNTYISEKPSYDNISIFYKQNIIDSVV